MTRFGPIVSAVNELQFRAWDLARKRKQLRACMKPLGWTYWRRVDEHLVNPCDDLAEARGEFEIAVALYKRERQKLRLNH